LQIRTTAVPSPRTHRRHCRRHHHRRSLHLHSRLLLPQNGASKLRFTSHSLNRFLCFLIDTVSRPALEAELLISPWTGAGEEGGQNPLHMQSQSLTPK
jgi:hypothetical protein